MLGYYGWISEAVFETASIAPGRKSFATRHPRYCRFTFAPLAVNRYQFLRGVQRIALEGRQIRCQVPCLKGSCFEAGYTTFTRRDRLIQRLSGALA